MGALAPLKRLGRGLAYWAAGDFLPVASGGTGAITAPSARRALGVAFGAVTALSGTYTATAADAGTLFACTGTWSFSLPSAAAVGSNYAIEIANAGTGKITLTPNGSDTIRGQSSLVVNRQESGILVSDGANWQAVGFAPVVVASSVTDGSGYVRWSNGFTQQWGTGAGEAAFSFPLSFSSKPAVLINFTTADTGATYLEAVHLSQVTTSGAFPRPRYITNGGPVSGDGNTYNWFAEGVI